MKRNIVLTLLMTFTILWSSFVVGQASGGGTYIDGSVNPYSIPDNIASRVVYLAFSLPANPTYEDQLHQVARLRNAGITDSNDVSMAEQALANFKAQYNNAVAAYNASPEQLSDIGTAETSIDTATTNASSSMQSGLTPNGWNSLQTYVQNAKNRVKMWTVTSSGPNGPVVYGYNAYTDQSTLVDFPLPGSGEDPGFLLEAGVEGIYGTIYQNCSDQVTISTAYAGGGWAGIGSAVISAAGAVAAAGDGTLLALGTDNTIKTLGTDFKSWPIFANNNFSFITAGSKNVIWALDKAIVTGGHNVYQYNANTQTFTQVTGGLTDISVGSDGYVWGVNSNGNIYRWNGSSFVLMPGRSNGNKTNQVSAANQNSAFVLGTDGHIYTYNQYQNAWVLWDRTKVLNKLGGIGTHTFGVDSAGAVWQYVTGSGWRDTGGRNATSIVASGPADVWVTTTFNQAYRLYANYNFAQTWVYPHGVYGNNNAELMLQTAPPGSQFNLQADDQVYDTCLQTYLMNTGFFDNYFLLTFVRSQITSDIGTNCGPTDEQLCDYPIRTWCTPATTPPSPFNPVEVRDHVFFWTNFFGWDIHGLCVRALSTDPWYCGNLTEYGRPLYGTPANIPPIDCTKE